MNLTKIKINNIFDIALDFSLKHRYRLIITAAVIAAAVIAGLVVYNSHMEARDSSEAVFDQIMSMYNYLETETNAASYDKLIRNASNNLYLLPEQYPKTVAATRARLLQGRICYMNYLQGYQGSLNESLSFYNAAYEIASSDYYRALALIGRATCYEEKKDYMNASQDYEQVITGYSLQGLNPVALIGLARIRELQNPSDPDLAVALYKKIVSDYSNSSWIWFAKGRIYYLSDPIIRKSMTNSSILNLNSNPLKISPIN